jgi:cytochrome c biogenesis protein CcdA/thioredoxin-related protein
MNRILSALLAIFCITLNLSAQIEDPISWEINLYETAIEGQVEVIYNASLDPCWHIYSQFLDSDDGPIATAFYNEENETIEGVTECEPNVSYDPNFMMDLKYFKEEVYWSALINLADLESTDTLKGSLLYMVCDAVQCLPPTDVYYALPLSELNPAASRPDLCPPSKHLCKEDNHGEGDGQGDGGLIWIFLMGFGLGFAALLTPCVFPMIPMTVSFFTKTSKTRAQGIKNALLYGFFIIFIYTGLGLALTAIFGVDIMNVISTDPFFNVGLFILLLIFGMSFLGAFEIQLPQSWANKADAASDRGGIIGIFFMAATLAIVSFSCTGPLIGGALAGAATGSFAAPTAVMLGFSIALSIPFMLFSAFPGWLNSLPSSGGWLNTVKVVLGLLEIGFAFKFLSNADLVLQLGLLQRELFIAIWIAISLVIAIYLFGWITLPHDSKTERIGVFRFGTGMLFFTLGIYLVPGMWGAPVSLISGFPPPLFYSESGGSSVGASGDHNNGYVEAHYRDYDEAMAAAIDQNKPLLLDFTGWACVNCRKMEEQVWTDKRVSKILNEDVILVSLYVDDRTKLPEEEWRVEEYGGKEFHIRTIGKKWSYLQASQFDRNAQPFYVLLDHNGTQIGGSAGYDPDPDAFLEYINDALAKF